VQRRAGGQCEASGSSGIVRDLGLDENDVKHGWGYFYEGSLRRAKVMDRPRMPMKMR
jgi:hypothetical protein